MAKRKHMTNTQLNAAADVLIPLIEEHYKARGVDSDEWSAPFRRLQSAFNKFRTLYSANRTFSSTEGMALVDQLSSLDPSHGHLLYEFSMAGVEWGSTADTATYRLHPVNGVEIEIEMRLDRTKGAEKTRMYDVRNAQRIVTSSNARDTLRHAPAGPNMLSAGYGSPKCTLTNDGVYVEFLLGWIDPQMDVARIYEGKRPMFNHVMVPGNCDIVREYMRKKAALDMAESGDAYGGVYVPGVGARFGRSFYYPTHVFIDNLAERLVTEGAKEVFNA